MIKKFTILLISYISLTSNYFAQTALDFDGVNDYAGNEMYLGQEDNFTFEAKFQYRTGNTTYQTIVGFGNAVEIKLFNSELWYLVNNGGGGYCNPPFILTDSTWYHVALVRNAGTWEFYVDGVSLNVYQSDVPEIPDFHTFHMGGRSWAEQMNGVIDEVRIWKTARTAQEIMDNKDQCLTGTETGLFLYYMMEDGAGSTLITDATGGGNHAFLYNMAPQTDWIASTESGCTAAPCTATLNNTIVTTDDTITSLDINADYQWYNCDLQTIVAGSTGQSFFTTSLPGNYAVIVSQNGCVSDTSECVYIDFANAGIEETEASDWITVSPNPGNGLFHIHSVGGTSLTITNLSGQIVYSTTVTEDQNTIDLGHLASGNYILNAKNTVSGKQAVERITILK